MTIRQYDVGAMHIAHETTFATEVASFLSAALPVPFKRGTCKLIRDDKFGDPMHAKQRLDDMDVQIKLPGQPTLELEVNLEVMGSRADDAETAERTWLGLMLDAAFGHNALSGTVDGKSKLGTGTTVSGSGSTVNQINVASATAWEGGKAIGLATGSGGALECRVVLQPDTAGTPDIIQTKLQVSSVAAASSVVYAAATYALDCGGRASPSLQALVQGYDNQERWLLLGGALDSITFKLGTRALPSIVFRWKFANILQANGTATTLDVTGDLLSRYTYANINTLVEKDSEFRIQEAGISTLSAAPLRKASQIEIKLNIEYVPIYSPSGALGIVGWVRRNKLPAVEMSFTEPRDESVAWETGMNAASPTTYAAYYQIGSSTTRGAWLFDLPALQTVNVEPLQDLDGISAVKVSMMGRGDYLSTGISTDAEWVDFRSSAFRIHMF